MSGISRLAGRRALKISLSEIEFSCPGLPRDLDGFTILHLSDPHLEATPAVAAQAIECLTGLTADIAVLTGDFQIGERRSDPARSAALLQPLVAAMNVRAGVYGVLGNHDSWRMVAPLESIGMRMLVNEHLTIDTGAAALHLVGLDDIHAFYTEHADQALRAAPDGFRILLVHTPEIAGAAADSGYDLYLAGHTHGGQICLPSGRPILTALDANRRLASGRWRIGAMHGYTNRGLGIGGLPIRINCPAEIALLRLRSVPD